MKVAPEYDFFKWVIRNDIGDVTGIGDDAPDEAKKAFDEFMRGDPLDEYLYLVPAEDDRFSVTLNERYFGTENAADAAAGYLQSTVKVFASDGSVVRYNFHPEGSMFEHVICHDLGHMTEWTLVNMRCHDPADRAMMRRFCTVAGQIYEEAKKELSESGELPSDLELRRGISECATLNLSETFAEAMVDYTANGDKANPLSIKMIEAAKRIYREEPGIDTGDPE